MRWFGADRGPACAAVPLVLCVCGLFTAERSVHGAADRTQHPYTIDDMLNLEELGDSSAKGGSFSFSPDGKRFAFALCRSRAQSPSREFEHLIRNAHCDVWVQMGPKALPLNISNGQTEDSGWFAPQWSPDGSSLGMLSTRDGGSLWVWNSDRNEIKRVSGRSPGSITGQSFSWIDARTLIYDVLPINAPAQQGAVSETRAITSRAWQQAIRGLESTASLLPGGIAENPRNARLEDAELWLISLDGKERMLTAGVDREDWRPSPTGVAYISPSLSPPQSGDSSDVVSGGRSEVRIVTLSGQTVPLRSLPHEAVVGSGVAGQSLRWSPTNDALAFLAREHASDVYPKLYRVGSHTGQGFAHEIPGLAIRGAHEPLFWSNDGSIVVRASRIGADRSTRAGYPDWWRIGREDKAVALTANFKKPPHYLYPLPGYRDFVGLADGNLWRLNATTGSAHNLTAHIQRTIEIAWPGSSAVSNDDVPQAGRTYSRLVVSTTENNRREFWIVDLSTGETTRVATPSASVELAAFSPAAAACIFVANDDHGLRLWRVGRDTADPQLLLERNTHLRAVAPTQWRRVDYVSEAGQPLPGWLLLPPGFTDETRYPMVTMPYPEAVMTADDPLSGAYQLPISKFSELNPQIMAAQGYVVLFPSMPLKPHGEADDPYFRLTEGVIPAVDRAIELGIADPQRLFVLGHSFGAYATYGLVTLTSRFRGATAISGFVDILSVYGTFRGNLRYTDRPQRYTRQQGDIRGQTRMHDAPWEDPNRYLRNSPLIYAGQVQTPILIIHGDMDFVPIQQAEEFFRALYEQGKRVDFVRYWGEDHTIQSPPNIRDMWQRILTFFAAYGGTPFSSEPKGEQS